MRGSSWNNQRHLSTSLFFKSISLFRSVVECIFHFYQKKSVAKKIHENNITRLKSYRGRGKKLIPEQKEAAKNRSSQPHSILNSDKCRITAVSISSLRAKLVPPREIQNDLRRAGDASCMIVKDILFRRYEPSPTQKGYFSSSFCGLHF